MFALVLTRVQAVIGHWAASKAGWNTDTVRGYTELGIQVKLWNWDQQTEIWAQNLKEFNKYRTLLVEIKIWLNIETGLHRLEANWDSECLLGRDL